MFNPRQWWRNTRSSFWFVPSLIVVGAMCLAALMVWLDTTVELDGVRRWPLLFGAGEAGARGLLATVAGSMVTVAGVVFSITLVALSLTSSQYTSRVLRNFMRDPVNQIVLGVFLGIFAYCLVVLRTIRGGDEGRFVPSLAVLGGLALSFVGIAVLIYFIHHISVSIQASSIIARVAQETTAALDDLFPADIVPGPDDSADAAAPYALHEWKPVPALRTGYIETVDQERLAQVAERRHTIIRMNRGVGDFVVEGTPLVFVALSVEGSETLNAAVNAPFVIGRQRSVQDDPGFGIRQLVDIALHALSPGVNDSTTAAMCVDYLSAILAGAVGRRISGADGVEGRVIVRGPTFQSMVDEAFDEIRRNADGNVAILIRLLHALETIVAQSTSRKRTEALRDHAERIASVSDRSVVSPYDRARVEMALRRCLSACGAPAPVAQ